MKLFLPKDVFTKNPVPPRLFLCTPSGKIINELQATDISLDGKWNSYSTLSFSMQMKYSDILTGEAKVHPMYDKLDSPRQIYAENIGFFIIQEVDDTSGGNDIKNITAFSAEYAVANKYLTSFFVNTGEIGSIEVTYNENMYGLDYSTDVDSFYKLASGVFDPYESYYMKEYTSTTDYTYQQVQIADAAEYAEYIAKNNDSFAQPHEQLYVKKFANVQFYNPNKEGLSLLHLVVQNIPGWEIGYVDETLWHRERSFSKDRISIYDFLMNEVADTFGCIFEWDTITKTINVYEEVEDGIEENNTISSRWATDVYISKENLASEVKVRYSADNIKTKLTVSGGEEMNISEVNLDRNEIMNLSYYHNLDWMEPDLYDAYSRYLAAIKEAQTGLDKYGLPSSIFPMSHADAVKGWVAAQNRESDLMNAVPAENDAVLVGDEFKKLYCMYTPINTAYSNITLTDTHTKLDTLYVDSACKIPVNKRELSNGDSFIVQHYIYAYNSSENAFKNNGSAISTAMNALVNRLNLYYVDEDTAGNKTDNILLKLKSSKSNTATIRIYDPKKKAPNVYDHSIAYYERKISSSGVASYKQYPLADNAAFDTYNKNNPNSPLYTNNYTIQLVITNADSGIESEPAYWSMDPENLPSYKPFTKWIRGEMTAEEMGLDDDEQTWTISYIGTMGAYLVLSENDFTITDNTLVPSKEHLMQYGVNMLREKHDVYTTIFQTQTEAMFSKDGYQCTASPNAPTGSIAEGTRWLDTDSVPVKLYRYSSGKWLEVTSDSDVEGAQNYTRYIDNYQKLQAVQEVLLLKERESEYLREGHAVEDRNIDFSAYSPNSSGSMSYNGRLLEKDMHRAAEAHFKKIGETTGVVYTLVRHDMNQNLPLYTFTTSYDPIKYAQNTSAYNPNETYYLKTNVVYNRNTSAFNALTEYYIKEPDVSIYTNVSIPDQSTFNAYQELYVATGFASPVYIVAETASEEAFSKYGENTLYVVESGHVYAVYLRGKVPYVAYMNSRGVYQMIRDYIRDKTEMSSFFTNDQWIRLAPFIREDEFTDSNFFLTGYESEEEKIKIGNELMESADRELKTLCQPSLEFSMTMANILALPEFSALVNQFQLGNFIRVKIRDGYVKRSRLLEVHINFSDLSDFSCTFGNLVTTKSEIDKHAELLAQAVTAGKQVAAASGTWQKAADKANQLEEAIASGLQNAALQVGRASGQAIEWSENGFYCRKFVDGTTDQYEDEQIAIINNKIVFTNDNWQTSRAALGEFQVDTNADGEAETVYGLIASAVVSGYIQGSVINGGSLKIGGTGGTFIVNEDGSVQILGPEGTEKYADNRFQIRLEYDGATVFTDQNDKCTITCIVYDQGKDITQSVIGAGGTFLWSNSVNGWAPTYVNNAPNVIVVTHNDVNRNTQVSCEVDFDETKLNV